MAYRFSSLKGFFLYIDFAALPHELEKKLDRCKNYNNNNNSAL
jgi:hypothetical protein